MLLRNTRLCECRIGKAQVNLCFRSVDRALRCNNSGADWNLADRLNTQQVRQQQETPAARGDRGLNW